MVDRSASGDGSKLETRFVCRLLHYDMVWPRVRVDQLRREKLQVDLSATGLKVHDKEGAEKSDRRLSYERRPQTRSMTAGAPSEHSLAEEAGFGSQPNEEAWYTTTDNQPNYAANQEQHDLQEEAESPTSSSSKQYQPGATRTGRSDHDAAPAAANDDMSFAADDQQFPCSECHEMQDIPAVSVACMLGHVNCLHALLHEAVLQHRSFNAAGGNSNGTFCVH